MWSPGYCKGQTGCDKAALKPSYVCTAQTVILSTETRMHNINVYFNFTQTVAFLHVTSSPLGASSPISSALR